MHFHITLTAVILRYAVLVTSTAPASLLGPGYPPPTDLTSNCSLVPAAWSNFTKIIESYILKNQTVEGLVPSLGSYTFSVGTFSIHDPEAAKALQYHHTGPDVKSSNAGVKQVDGDSVYRAASITKLFTVYLTLIKIGSGYWDRPITDFIPELAAFANRTAADPLHVVDWKGVTLGALAGQIAGIPRDTPLFNSDLLTLGADLTSLGLPPLNITNPSSIDPCIRFVITNGALCPRAPYFEAVTKRAPVFSPWTSPIYTNGGYALLSLAVENITGKSFGDMFQEDMFKPLGLMSTSYSKPPSLTHAVLPGGNASKAGQAFVVEAANDAASGGIFSTINDLGKFGLSILNSTLLSPEETNKWMKPISHTGSLQLSVGRPWEIFRITQPATGRTNDLYTKEGDVTGYSSYMVLSPDHGAGFSILIAGNQSPVIANTVVADALTSTVVHALESEAAAEATRKFAGKYVSKSSSLNSSVTLAVDPSYGSGLVVTSWISNSTNMFPWLAAAGIGDELSLFQTDLRTAPPGRASQVAFRGTFGKSKYRRDVGPFTDQVTTDVAWEDVDANSYGGVSLDLFIFDVDSEGRAVAVSPAATRATLHKAA